MKKLFMISTCIVIGAVLFFALMSSPFVQTVIVHADEQGKISTIGGVEVGELTEDEMVDALQQAITQWQIEPLVVEGGGTLTTIDKTHFQFDIPASIASYERLTDKAWYAFWKAKKIVHIPLELTYDETINQEIERTAVWEKESTIAAIIGQASYLKDDVVVAEVGDISALQGDRLALAMQDIPSDSAAVADLALALDEKVIGSGELFSFAQAVAPVATNANYAGMSFTATLLYDVALQVNTGIYEKHSQNVQPTYAKPGIEAAATVTGTHDLKFINKSKIPLLIRAAVENNQLKIELYSASKVDEVLVRTEEIKDIEPKAIIRYSKDLPVGASSVIDRGSDGKRVFIYRTINGIEQTPIREFYAPKNRIVLKSSREPAPAPNITVASDGAIPGETASTTSPVDKRPDAPSTSGGQPGSNGSGGNVSSENKGNASNSGNTGTNEKGNTIEKEVQYDKGGNVINQQR